MGSGSGAAGWPTLVVIVSISTSVGDPRVFSPYRSRVGIVACKELQSDGRFSPSGLEFSVMAD
jgi:hypothetical protein